jgi:hypothetical protein
MGSGGALPARPDLVKRSIPIGGFWWSLQQIVGLRGPLGDVDHVGNAVLALPGLTAGLAQRPAGAQVARQLAPQRTARLHVQRLVDRFGRHPHLRVVGEPAAQPTGDLLGREAPQIVPARSAAAAFVASLAGFGCWRARRPWRALEGPGVRRRRPVAAVTVGVALELPGDGRRRASESPRDRALLLAAGGCASAISSRSANDTQRPFRVRPRRGRTPPQAATQRVPCLR